MPASTSPKRLHTFELTHNPCWDSSPSSPKTFPRTRVTLIRHFISASRSFAARAIRAAFRTPAFSPMPVATGAGTSSRTLCAKYLSDWPSDHSSFLLSFLFLFLRLGFLILHRPGFLICAWTWICLAPDFCRRNGRRKAQMRLRRIYIYTFMCFFLYIYIYIYTPKKCRREHCLDDSGSPTKWYSNKTVYVC